MTPLAALVVASLPPASVVGQASTLETATRAFLFTVAAATPSFSWRWVAQAKTSASVSERQSRSLAQASRLASEGP